MEIGNFEITCTECGSKDVIIINVHKDSDFDENFKRIKCKNCHLEIEI